MLIDWFTVIAQILNFIVLVWLLHRFLYKPVLRAIDNREKRIAAQLQDAAARETAAKVKQDEFERKNTEFDRQKEGALKKVAEESQTEKRCLMDGARKDVDLFRSKMLDALQNDQKNLGAEMMNHAQQEVFAIARKTLAELSGTELETAITGVFITRLRNMDTKEREQLLKAMTPGSPANINISSAFNLNSERQDEIKSVVHEIFKGGVAISFKIAPELISGIELSCGGYKTSWSINNYLNSLQKKTEVLLKNKIETDFKA